MKTKIITTIVALATMACASYGASFNWGTGSVKVTFNGEVLTDATGYLVYLGTGDATYDIVEYAVNNAQVDEKNTTSTGLAAAKGRITGTFGSPMSDPMPNTTDKLADGSIFGMYITWTDADGTEWINVASSTYTVTGLADDNSVLSDAVFDFNFDQSSDGTLTSGGGWASAPIIPEPATATLALAGVAMLFRRRK